MKKQILIFIFLLTSCANQVNQDLSKELSGKWIAEKEIDPKNVDCPDKDACYKKLQDDNYDKAFYYETRKFPEEKTEISTKNPRTYYVTDFFTNRITLNIRNSYIEMSFENRPIIIEMTKGGLVIPPDFQKVAQNLSGEFASLHFDNQNTFLCNTKVGTLEMKYELKEENGKKILKFLPSSSSTITYSKDLEDKINGVKYIFDFAKYNFVKQN